VSSNQYGTGVQPTRSVRLSRVRARRPETLTPWPHASKTASGSCHARRRTPYRSITTRVALLTRLADSSGAEGAFTVVRKRLARTAQTEFRDLGLESGFTHWDRGLPAMIGLNTACRAHGARIDADQAAPRGGRQDAASRRAPRRACEGEAPSAPERLNVPCEARTTAHGTITSRQLPFRPHAPRAWVDVRVVFNPRDRCRERS
jgi:hypothetical protein